MSTSGNKALIQRWFEEVWNKRRESAIFELLHPAATVYGLSDSPEQAIHGPAEFIPFWKKFVSAIPDLRVEVDSVVVEDDRIAARCTVRGHHTGPELGIEPTGAAISFTGMCLVHVRDGRLCDAWNNFDFLELYKQLGLFPAK